MARPDKCDIFCECGNKGFLEVINEGQFESDAEIITVYCTGPLGEWMLGRATSTKRASVYDPKTMILKGEKIPQRQRQLF